MTRQLACFAILAALTAPTTSVLAANSTNGAPPEAKKEGGIAGDSSGAIRALGGTTQNDFREGTNKVDVPKLGGSANAGRVDGAPAGITRGR